MAVLFLGPAYRQAHAHDMKSGSLLDQNKTSMTAVGVARGLRVAQCELCRV
jgi:hypothetical protein